VPRKPIKHPTRYQVRRRKGRRRRRRREGRRGEEETKDLS